jgi:beta-glucosidase
MGYRGTVISDWWAMEGWQGPVADNVALEQARNAALAGLDIEVPWTLNYKFLSQLAGDNPDVARAIDASAKRILEQKFRFKQAYGNGESSEPWTVKGSTRSTLNGRSIATNQDHLNLAEEAAIKSAVLLDNGPAGAPVLPLSGITSIAVVGDDVNFQVIDTSLPKGLPVVSTSPRVGTFNFGLHVPVGDRGSSRVNADPAHSVGPTDGLAMIGAAHGVTSVTPSTTAAGAAAADATVVVVGYTPGDEGEEYAIPAGGDRAAYTLPHAQSDLISAVLTANMGVRKTVIIIESGSIVDLPWLAHENKNQATIWAGYAGMRAGLAYAKLIFADNGTNFSGKMPMAWPRAEIPYRFKGSDSDPESLQTPMGYFFGYREYDRRKAAGETVNLWFEFGRGLSYTTYAYSNLVIPCMGEGITKKGILQVEVDIQNTGSVAGEEVAMLFVKGPPASGPGDRAVKELKSFAKVALQPNEKKTVKLPVRIQDLRHWQGDQNGMWVIDNGTYTIQVAGSGADEDLAKTQGTFEVHD